MWENNLALVGAGKCDDPFLTHCKGHSKAPVTKDRLTREKQIYLVKVLSDMGVFRNEDPKPQRKLSIFLAKVQ